MAAIAFSASTSQVLRKFTTFASAVKAERISSSSFLVSFPSELSVSQNLRQNKNKFSTAVYAVDEEVGDFKRQSENPADGVRLYVGNLPFNVDSESLARLFSEAGEVEQVDVIYDRDTGRSRGFAFVSMATNQEARDAIEQFDGKDLDNRPLKVTFPTPRGERAPRTERGPPGSARAPPAGVPGAGNKLYVGNLSWKLDDFGLADIFAEYGNVVEAKVIIDRDSGRSKGFGFVTFSTREEGQTAVNGLDGVDIDGRPIRVSVAQDRPPRPSY